MTTAVCFQKGKCDMSGTITALVMQKRDHERVNVFLDGEYAFSLTLIEAAPLRKGQALSDDDISKLKAIDDRHKAFDRTVKFLASRPRSEREIRQKLQEKEYDDVVIDHVIKRLQTLGYVDDHEFARFWVRNREEFRPRGPMALRSELKQKGIPNPIIDEVLDDLDSVDSARRAAEKKLRSMRGLDRMKFRQRMGSFLGRRGFRYETISEVVGTLIAENTYPENTDTPYFLEDMDNIDEE